MAVTIDGSNTPTAGGVIYGDGTEYASTAAGTSGQFLTSAGSSAPTWTTPTIAGASWVYLSTVTASAAATADIETTFDATYDMYAIVAENILPSTTNTTLRARFKIGGSYLTTSTYRYLGIVANDASTATPFFASGGNTTTIQISTGLSNTAANTSAFTAFIPNPAGATIKAIYANGVAVEQTPAAAMISMAGYNAGTGALTGVRFYQSTGNISGTFRLYGIKNS